MRSFTELWPTLKRLLAYGSPWRKPLAIAVAMIPFLLAAILFSFFGLQRRKWQQGQD